MATKLPLSLATGDRLVVRYGHHTSVVVCDLFARDPLGLHLTFTDGSMVTITDLTLPVEVAE